MILLQVLSETVASALQFVDEENTRETRKLIRMMDTFFDCGNVRSPLKHKLKCKDNRAPYRKVNDWIFKVRRKNISRVVVSYLHVLIIMVEGGFSRLFRKMSVQRRK